jgi:chromatin segregation and condensation protein Rec8/ScpA/Scc1 (kleisin family)
MKKCETCGCELTSYRRFCESCKKERVKLQRKMSAANSEFGLKLRTPKKQNPKIDIINQPSNYEILEKKRKQTEIMRRYHGL